MQHTEARHNAFYAEYQHYQHTETLKGLYPLGYGEWLETELEAARAEAQEASIREVDMPY